MKFCMEVTFGGIQLHFILSHNAVIVCIQESKLNDMSRLPKFLGYAVIRRNRAGGGGLLTLVHHSFQFSETPDSHQQQPHRVNRHER